MKGTKKLTLVVVLAMVMNLFVFTGAYAADARMSVNWFEQVDREDVVISMNVKVTETNNRYALDFSAPTNASALQDLNQKQSGGMIALRGGEMFFRADGSWISNGQEYAENVISTDFDSNVWNNIKLKHTKADGKVKVYLNDTYVESYTLATPCTMPLNCVTIIADSTITTGCDVDIEYVRGTDKNTLGANITELSLFNKSFTIEFTEKVANTDLLDDVVIKSTNVKDGESAVTLTADAVDDTTVNYKWTESLNPATEYAIVLPEGLKSVSDVKCANNYFYFNTGDNKSETLSECNYNDGRAIVWPELTTEGQTLIVDAGEGHGKAYNAVDVRGVPYANVWKGLTKPSEDFYSISFDIKPMQASLKMGIEIRPTSGNPVSIAYGTTGYILAMNQYTNDGWLNLENVSTTWAKNNVIAYYNTSEWINYRAEFNGDKLTLYVNGVEKYTIANFGTFKEIAFNAPNGSSHTKGTQLMLLDNVKTEKISTPASVKQVRFTDKDGKEVAPFGTLKNQMSSVKITFNTEYDSLTANETLKDAVKLYYGNEDINYSGTYDAKSKTYTITPAVGIFVHSGEQVKVVVTDATDSNTGKASCTSYVTAGEFEPYFTFKTVNNSGTEIENFTAGETYYVEISAADYDETTKKANIIVAQYKNDGTLEEVLLKELDIKGEVTVGKDSTEPLAFTAKSDVNKIKVFAFDKSTVRPLIRSIDINNR